MSTNYSYILTSDGKLYHTGIKGMKWGRRRYQNIDGSLTPAGKQRYRSTSIGSAVARRSNQKVDKSFNDWKENAQKRDNAIALGKRANEAKLAYEKDRSNKTLKRDYDSANKEYKKALRSNTTYRKGVVRQEVGRDVSRKYLSEAKRVKKQLDSNPSDKKLQKQYNSLMSKHDVERAKARRAIEVGAKRSRAKASVKRVMTMSAKAAATATVTAIGVAAANKYLSSRGVAINGKQVSIGISTVESIISLAKRGRQYAGFVY